MRNPRLVGPGQSLVAGWEQRCTSDKSGNWSSSNFLTQRAEICWRAANRCCKRTRKSDSLPRKSWPTQTWQRPKEEEGE